MTSKPISKICLNMIVKNEGKIIERLLSSVLPLIDTYCICDTGSTDNTVEIIETFFREKNITGKIVYEPFRDFGYNRTYAMLQCRDLPNSDYLLLLDADMILEISSDLDIKQFKSSLHNAEAYHIFQGSPSFYYKNVRILKNSREYSYWGVTHEYVKTTPGTRYDTVPINQIFINDVGDGGSKTEKTSRDIRLLKKGLEELPNNDRYTFYLANSYRDMDDYETAIETYRKRIDLGGWNEEIWYCYYSIGKCYVKLKKVPAAIEAWLEGFEILPDRIENIYEIITHYRNAGKNKLAYMFYAIAREVLEKKTDYDHLFLEKNVYDYLLDYELSIIGYYYNKNNYDIIQSSMKVLTNDNVEYGTQINVLNNYKFYTPKIKTLECPHKRESFRHNYKVLQSIGDTINIDRTVFKSSTPSISYDMTHLTRENIKTKGNTRIVVNVRFVNYYIDDNGGYINQEHIITRNVIALIDISNMYKWIKMMEYELDYTTQYDKKYVGIEDIRLFSTYGLLGYSGNRGMYDDTMLDDTIMVETGVIKKSQEGEGVTSSVAFLNRLRFEPGRSQEEFSNGVSNMTDTQPRSVEKNWVFFLDHQNQPKMVYKWNSLTVGSVPNYPDHNTSVKNKILDVIYTAETPALFKMVRGSTNGVTMDDGEVWFICHVVSYENRRYYYHLLVVLDNKTYKMKRYSRLFTFDGEKVEYTLGFIYIEELKQFMIGYSTMDNETKYMLVERNKLDELFYTSEDLYQ